MNHSTASNRLVKDLLFNFINEKEIRCYHCNEELTRDTFSIEHKDPWLDSEDPIGLFFDLNNVSFSHLSCNCSKSRRNVKYATDAERKDAKNKRRRDRWASLTKEERQRERRKRYLKDGC